MPVRTGQKYGFGRRIADVFLIQTREPGADWALYGRRRHTEAQARAALRQLRREFPGAEWQAVDIHLSRVLS